MIDIIGYLAGTLVVLSLLPQIIKSWKTKSTKDLSLWRSVIYITGIGLWLIYGILISNGPLTYMNIILLSFSLSILYLILKYK